MTNTHNAYPGPASWNVGELSPDDMQHAKELLGEIYDLAGALGDLGNGLAPGSSRTVYNLPLGQFPRNATEAMIAAAREGSDAIGREGLKGIADPPFELREDESPAQFGAPTVPVPISPDALIGYMRMEATENGVRPSVGCLDPGTRTHYSLPL